MLCNGSHKDTAWLFEQLKSTESKLGAMDAFVYGDGTICVFSFCVHVLTIYSSTDKSMSSSTYRSYFHPVPLAATSANIGYMGDDHVPFLRRGVPVLHLITEPFPRGEPRL